MRVQTFICNMLHENCYVVYDEVSCEAAVIDPGVYWDDEKQLFVDFIRDNGLKVKYLLCTHLHFDHIFGVPFVAHTYGVKLSASLYDTPWIEHFTHTVARFGIRPNGEPRPVGHPLHDGDMLTLGDGTIECIATPGHSSGGLCFYVRDWGLLFAGDTLFHGSIGRTDFSDGDYTQLIRSIQERLLVLPHDVVVYPGHGETTTIGDEMKFNPYL